MTKIRNGYQEHKSTLPFLLLLLLQLLSNANAGYCNYTLGSLNSVKNCLCQIETEEELIQSITGLNNVSSRLEMLTFLKASHFFDGILDQKVENYPQAFERYPCFLNEIGRFFGLGAYSILASKEFAKTAEDAVACSKRSALQPEHVAQLVYLGNMETNSSLLRDSLVRLRMFNAGCIIVMCSQTCSNIIMRMAGKFELDRDNKIWVLITKDLLDLTIQSNLITLTISKPSLGRMPEAHQNLTNQTCGQKYEAFDKGRVATLLSLQSTLNDSSGFAYHLHAYEINRMSWIELGVSTDGKLSFNDGALSVLDSSPNSVRRPLRIVTLIESPFTMLHVLRPTDSAKPSCETGILCWHYEMVAETNETKLVARCCIGYCMDLVEHLKKDLRYDIDLKIVADGKYGAKETGEWNGLVGDVYRRNADVAIAPLTITSKRAVDVDFTDPFMFGGVALATIARKTELPFLNFEAFKPLSGELWLCTFVIFLGYSFLIVLTERICSGDFRRYTWRKSILYMAGLLFQKETGGEDPDYLGTRTIAVALSMSMLIIMSSYTAVKTANQVTYTTSLPITGFKDAKVLNPTKNFIYATVNASSFTQMFRDSNDPGWNRMYNFMKPYNFIDTNHAVEDLKAGRLHGIIHDYPVLFYYIAKEPDCKIQFAGTPLQDPGFGMAVPKGSPLKAILSQLIQRYKEDGTLEDMRGKWLSSKCVDSNAADRSEAKEIGIVYFGGYIAAMLIFTALSAVVFMVEIMFVRLKKKSAKIPAAE